MSNTEIKKGDTWVNRLDETNTVTISNVGAYYVTGSSTKDGSYVGSRDDFLHYFKPQPKENLPPSKQEKNMSDKHDPVNSPSHYTSDPSGVHCIEIAENWDFLLGNTLKYIWRHGKKSSSDSIEDLEKARWYLDRKINKLKSERRASMIEAYTDPDSEPTFTYY